MFETETRSRPTIFALYPGQLIGKTAFSVNRRQPSRFRTNSIQSGHATRSRKERYAKGTLWLWMGVESMYRKITNGQRSLFGLTSQRLVFFPQTIVFRPRDQKKSYCLKLKHRVWRLHEAVHWMCHYCNKETWFCPITDLIHKRRQVVKSAVSLKKYIPFFIPLT